MTSKREWTSKAIIRLTLSLWASKEIQAASLQFIDHVLICGKAQLWEITRFRQ